MDNEFYTTVSPDHYELNSFEIGSYVYCFHFHLKNEIQKPMLRPVQSFLEQWLCLCMWQHVVCYWTKSVYMSIQYLFVLQVMGDLPEMFIENFLKV